MHSAGKFKGRAAGIDGQYLDLASTTGVDKRPAVEPCLSNALSKKEEVEASQWVSPWESPKVPVLKLLETVYEAAVPSGGVNQLGE